MVIDVAGQRLRGPRGACDLTGPQAELLRVLLASSGTVGHEVLRRKAEIPTRRALDSQMSRIRARIEEECDYGCELCNQQEFLRAWGGDRRGRLMSVAAAALFFGGMHLLDGLSGRPMLNVLFQSGQAVVLGVWLGALVLRTGSQYPAVVFHVLFNLAGYLLFGRQGLEPAPAAWLLLAALLLPLAAIGVGLLTRPFAPPPASRVAITARRAH